MQDANEKHWARPLPLQYAKHKIVREYLKAWFPILGFSYDRILYLETHAGRGKFTTGEDASPLVAIKTLLKHSHLYSILRNSEVRFIFMEKDQTNADLLIKHIKSLKDDIPKGIYASVSADDCFKTLKSILSHLEKTSSRLATAFVFVDPFGFTIPGDILSQLFKAGRVELFVNIMWREMDMQMANVLKRGVSSSTLDSVFNGERWRDIDRSLDYGERAEKAITLLKDVYGAKWVTSIKMLGKNNKERYILAHFTNSDKGRDVMKNVIWKICPDGGFYARSSEDPRQAVLITPEPDLKPLETWLHDQLKDGSERWQKLDQRLLSELWLPKHLAQIIRKYRRDGLISAEEYSGRFSKKANPLLTLKGEQNGGKQ